MNRIKLAEILGIPKNYSIELLIALGYAKQRSFAEKFTGDVKYWIDKNNNLHVPKRELKNAMHEESF